jgi:hypothetical protein
MGDTGDVGQEFLMVLIFFLLFCPKGIMFEKGEFGRVSPEFPWNSLGNCSALRGIIAQRSVE